jgi:hypothetical protein
VEEPSAELKKLEGQSTEQIKSDLQQMFSEGPLAELSLEVTQPLIDLGWRLDYGRRGIVRANHFLSLAQLKAEAEDMEHMSAEEAAAPHAPGELRLDDIEAAIDLLEEATEEEEKRKRP